MNEIASNNDKILTVNTPETQDYFKSLVPEAKKQLLRIMKNSRNEKIVANVATSIIDRAEGKKNNTGPIINISAEKMVLLNNTLKDLLGGE